MNSLSVKAGKLSMDGNYRVLALFCFLLAVLFCTAASNPDSSNLDDVNQVTSPAEESSSPFAQKIHISSSRRHRNFHHGNGSFTEKVHAFSRRKPVVGGHKNRVRGNPTATASGVASDHGSVNGNLSTGGYRRPRRMSTRHLLASHRSG